jgi:hypothetical protein
MVAEDVDIAARGDQRGRIGQRMRGDGNITRVRRARHRGNERRIEAIPVHRDLDDLRAAIGQPLDDAAHALHIGASNAIPVAAPRRERIAVHAREHGPR